MRPRPARSAARPRAGRPRGPARRARVRRPWNGDPSRLRDADDQRGALATAAAQSGRTDATTATLELEREVEHDPCAGHADRVTERDRPAVHVDLRLVEAEGPRRVDADGRERLVELH